VARQARAQNPKITVILAVNSLDFSSLKICLKKVIISKKILPTSVTWKYF